jgi:hypothetical protein
MKWNYKQAQICKVIIIYNTKISYFTKFQLRIFSTNAFQTTPLFGTRKWNFAKSHVNRTVLQTNEMGSFFYIIIVVVIFQGWGLLDCSGSEFYFSEIHESTG